LNLIGFQSNIFIGPDRRAVLADLGLMTAVLAETLATSDEITSLRWMAPELLSPEEFELSYIELTTASDIYALGMVILEVRYSVHHVQILNHIPGFDWKPPLFRVWK
jgi:serine/threonine protein kinase